MTITPDTFPAGTRVKDVNEYYGVVSGWHKDNVGVAWDNGGTSVFPAHHGGLRKVDPDRVEDYSQRADCQHCAAEGAACGRAHFLVLAYEWQTGRTSRPATKRTPRPSEKQVAFARKLLLEKEMSEVKVANRLAKLVNGELDKFEVSKLIDELLALPRKTSHGGGWELRPEVQRQDLVTEDGMYLRDGVVYKVQRAVHGSGNLYAKRLEVVDGQGSFEYAPGAVRQLRAADKMSLEDARQYGKLYGVCIVCGRTLTNEDSIAAGIGPICAQSF